MAYPGAVLILCADRSFLILSIILLFEFFRNFLIELIEKSPKAACSFLTLFCEIPCDRIGSVNQLGAEKSIILSVKRWLFDPFKDTNVLERCKEDRIYCPVLGVD